MITHSTVIMNSIIITLVYYSGEYPYSIIIRSFLDLESRRPEAPEAKPLGCRTLIPA